MKVYHRIQFDDVPEPGSLLAIQTHAFILRGIETYQRQDGSTGRLLVWESCCRACMAPMTIRTGLKAKGIVVNCADHKHAKTIVDLPIPDLPGAALPGAGLSEAALPGAVLPRAEATAADAA